MPRRCATERRGQRRAGAHARNLDRGGTARTAPDVAGRMLSGHPSLLRGRLLRLLRGRRGCGLLRHRAVGGGGVGGEEWLSRRRAHTGPAPTPYHEASHAPHATTLCNRAAWPTACGCARAEFGVGRHGADCAGRCRTNAQRAPITSSRPTSSPSSGPARLRPSSPSCGGWRRGRW